MNAFISNFLGVIAITSIGMDGEEIDQVTFLEKPRIHVKKGDYVATAIKTLDRFTCDYDVVEETKITTAIGKIVICRINSYGNALIAGPAKTNDMIDLINKLNLYKVDKILIDGAFSRQHFAKISQASVFVVGANYSFDIGKVVKSAQLTYKKYNLEETRIENQKFSDYISLIKNNDEVIILDYSTLIGNTHKFFKQSFEDVKAIYLPKTLTGEFVKQLIKNRRKISFDIIIDSATNIQLSDELLEQLFMLNMEISVVNPIKIVTVCYNPYSPRGYEFLDCEFKEKLEKVLDIEVINVLKEV
jgi:regulator of RNase E activity RraB